MEGAKTRNETSPNRLGGRSAPARRSDASGNGSGSLEARQLDWSFFKRQTLPGENVAYSLHDGHGRFLELAGRYTDVWGAEAAELRAKSLTNFHPDPGFVRAWLVSLEHDERGQTLELSLPKAGGQAVALNLAAIPLFVGESPDRSRVVVKAAQASPRPVGGPAPARRALSSLHESDGVFVSASPAWAALLEVREAEVVGTRLQDWVAKEDRAAADDFLARARPGQPASGTLLRVAAKSGSLASFLLSAAPEGPSGRLAVEAKDLTVGRERPDLDLLRASLELVSESVALLMRVGSGYRICFVNRAFEELCQYRQSSVAGCSLSCLNGPKTNARTAMELEAAMERQEPARRELYLYAKSGQPFWSKARLYPLRDAAGEAPYYIALIQDGTDAREAADELAEKNAALEKALANLKETQRAVIQQENLRALGQMASGIAHDFNNLLAPILGFSELLLKTPSECRKEEKLVSYLKKIQVAAKDGAAVVSRLREFYRSQNDPEAFTEIVPEDLVWQVRELTRHRWKNQAEGRGASIQFKTEVRAKRLIRGSESELRQVLANLVINSVDAIETAGSISIKARDEGLGVVIEIVDTGCGMDEETLSKCLDPFYTTKGKLGTGLGLSIVFGVVQRHGGRFSAQSKPGEGTRIRIELPAAEPQPAAEKTAQSEAAGASLSVMLVDDEEVLLEVVSELIASGGHHVETFSRPKEALEAFDAKAYDLVITDRAMPDMSGDQLAAAVKKAKPETPVYMITGFGDLIKESGDCPRHIDEVLAKPVPLDLLNQRLNELAAQKARQAKAGHGGGS